MNGADTVGSDHVVATEWRKAERDHTCNRGFLSPRQRCPRLSPFCATRTERDRMLSPAVAVGKASTTWSYVNAPSADLSNKTLLHPQTCPSLLKKKKKKPAHLI
jgi:hypothetical protein